MRCDLEEGEVQAKSRSNPSFTHRFFLSETFFRIGFVSFCILNYVLSRNHESNPNLSQAPRMKKRERRSDLLFLLLGFRSKMCDEQVRTLPRRARQTPNNGPVLDN
jgi:hypothetical protein